MSEVEKPQPTVLLVCKDLFFSSQMIGSIQRAGLTSRTCLSVNQCLEQVKQFPIMDIIVDLEIPTLDLPALRAAAVPPCRLTVFGSHVKVDLFAAAEAAGCDNILTRGQATSQLERLLKHWNSSPEA